MFTITLSTQGYNLGLPRVVSHILIGGFPSLGAARLSGKLCSGYHLQSCIILFEVNVLIWTLDGEVSECLHFTILTCYYAFGRQATSWRSTVLSRIPNTSSLGSWTKQSTKKRACLSISAIQLDGPQALCQPRAGDSSIF